MKIKLDMKKLFGGGGRGGKRKMRLENGASERFQGERRREIRFYAVNKDFMDFN